MSRNAISANPEHYIFKIFWGSMPPDPTRRPKKFFFSPPRDSKIFLESTSPKQKILDRTLVPIHEGNINDDVNLYLNYVFKNARMNLFGPYFFHLLVEIIRYYHDIGVPNIFHSKLFLRGKLSSTRRKTSQFKSAISK